MPKVETKTRQKPERSAPLKTAFTVKVIERLSPPAEGRMYVYDTRTPALALCITATGTKTFYLYRRVHGTPQRILLGRFPQMTIEQARDHAIKKHSAINDGINPNQEKRKARLALSLGEAFDHYFQNWILPRGSKRTQETDQSRWDCCLKEWSERKLASIGRDEVCALHARLGTERGKANANRAIQLLRRIYNHAAKVMGLEDLRNPARNLTMFAESARERFLQTDELERFFAAVTAEENDVLRDFFFLALWTGARSGNVKSMRWADVNLDAATWTIPATEFKTGKPLTIPLAPQALAILRDRLPTRINDYVLPGHGKRGHLEEPKGAWDRIRERSGLHDLRIHDLRRTLGSWQAALGSSLHVIGKSLGHTRPETTQIYARLNLDPVRESVNAATAAIDAARKKGHGNGEA